MQVRAATLADIPLLAPLFDAYRVFYRKESDLSAATAFLTARLNGGESRIYTAELVDGQLAGFVQLYPLWSSTRMAKLWLLNDLYVNPAYRGQGISLSLIDAAKELVKSSGACGMFLETEVTNQIGNRLYPRAGFQLNKETNYYTWDAP